MSKTTKQAEETTGINTRFAKLLDICQDETEKGRTVESSMIEYVTKGGNNVIFYDSPGHKSYGQEVIDACQKVTIGVFVVSAYADEYKNSLLCDDHALIMKAYGVKKIIVLINKCDTVDQSKCMTVGEKVYSYLIDKIGFTKDQLSLVPVSGLTGENLVTVDPGHWYKSLSFIDMLDRVIKKTQKPVPLDYIQGYIQFIGSGRYQITLKPGSIYPVVNNSMCSYPSKTLLTIETIFDDSNSSILYVEFEQRVPKTDVLVSSIPYPMDFYRICKLRLNRPLMKLQQLTCSINQQTVTVIVDDMALKTDNGPDRRPYFEAGTDIFARLVARGNLQICDDLFSSSKVQDKKEFCSAPDDMLILCDSFGVVAHGIVATKKLV